MSERQVVNALLKQLLEDRIAGGVRSVEHYQALFPGEDALIAEQYARCLESRDESVFPRRIGPFELVSEIGRGGQGVVYLAEDSRLGRRVALKVLNGLQAVTHDALNRLLREARIASRLDHPGICAVYETGIDAGSPYIAMQYIDGMTLAKHIANARQGVTGLDRSSIASTVALFEKVARALHAAHEAEVLHRDVKPANIMVNAAGEPVLLDFGLARDDDSELSTLTRSGDWFGTPAYMSPEQFARETARLDRRSDVWSLGVSLYEALTLRRPFDAPTRAALCQAVLTQSHEDARRLDPAIPRDLAIVIDAALEKDRDRRYASAEALANDLRAVLEHRPVAAKRIGAAGKIARWARREPALAGFVALAFVALPTISALIALRISDLPRLEAQRTAERERRKEELLARGFLQWHDGGDPGDALELFEKAWSLEGGSPEAVLAAAMLLDLKGDSARALRLIDEHQGLLGASRAAMTVRRACSRHLGASEAQTPEQVSAPIDALDYWQEGSRLLLEAQQGNVAAYAGAHDAYTRAYMLLPAPRVDWYLLALTAAAGARDETAFSQLDETVLRRWPELAITHFARGCALSDLWYSSKSASEAEGFTEEAVAAFSESIRLGADDRAYHNLGCLLQAQGKHEEAIAALQEALRRAPSRKETYLMLGQALRDADRFDESIACLRTAIKLFPHYAWNHQELGIALGCAGRSDEAIAEYRAALSIEPDFAEAHACLGNMLKEKGPEEQDEAVVHLRRAVELAPTNPNFHTQLGAALLAKGDSLESDILYEEAIAADREALSFDPNHARAHCELGLVLGRVGKYVEARDELRKGHELGSKQPDWEQPSGEWLDWIEKLVQQEQWMLDAATSEGGGDRRDILELASIAVKTRRWDLAARWYAAASERGMAVDDDTSFRASRIKIARAALQEPIGDAPASTGVAQGEVRRLRELAHTCMDLEFRERQSALVGEELRSVLQTWLSDPLLAPVREAPHLATLERDEAEAWTALWAEIREAAQ